ncbi:MAG: Fic/DOC family N-terminal domain-containing protein [Spirochaetota bacterium]
MKRGVTCTCQINSVSGEAVRAFVPNPLPPTPPLEIDSRHRALEQAYLALGRLDAITTLLPNPDLFLYAYVRREAATALRIFDALRMRPLSSIADLAGRADTSFPAAARAVATLKDFGIVTEITGRKRGRVFAYDGYISILNEGAEA